MKTSTINGFDSFWYLFLNYDFLVPVCILSLDAFLWFFVLVSFSVLFSCTVKLINESYYLKKEKEKGTSPFVVIISYCSFKYLLTRGSFTAL